jgi:hypothetical protein
MSLQLYKDQGKIDAIIEILNSIKDFTGLDRLHEIVKIVAPEKRRFTTNDLFASWISMKNNVNLNNGWIFKLNSFNNIPSFDDRCKFDGCVNCSITIEPRIVGATAEHWIERGVLGESNLEHINLNYCRISELQPILDWMHINKAQDFISRNK